MRLCLITCAVLLAGCGHKAAQTPPDLLTPAPGWTGPTPATESQFARAGAAEKAGRLMCNAQLGAIGALHPPPFL